MERGNFRVNHHLDVGRGVDSGNEVLGESFFQALAANHHGDLGSVRSEVHDRLTGGISAAYNNYRFVLAKRGFARPGAIKKARTCKAVLVRKIEPPVIHSRGANCGASDNLRAVGQIADAFPRKKLAANTFAQQQNFGAEFAGLLAGAFGEIRSRDSLRKSEVVFDFGAAAGLSTDDRAFDQNCFQPFGCAVHRGAQACRAAAINRQVVFGPRRITEPSEFFGDLANGRSLEPRAIGKKANGEARVVKVLELGLLADLFVRRQLNPLEWDITAMEKIPDRVRLCGSARAENTNVVLGLIHGRPCHCKPLGVPHSTLAAIGLC